MNNDEASKETKAQFESLEKRILFDLQRTLKDTNNNKDESKLLLTKPLKPPQDILDQPQQTKDASSLIHKLFKSEQYKTLYQSPLLDNKNDSHILHTDINVNTNPTELNDVHSLSESKKKIKDVVNIVSPLLSSSLFNVNNSTLTSNSNNSSVNLAHKLKKLLQSKTNESSSKLNVNGGNKDNKSNNDRDRGENGCESKGDNVLSETIHNDNKQCNDLFKSKFHSKMNTSSDIFKLSLIPLSNDSTSTNNTNNSKQPLGHSSQKSSPLDTDVHALFNNIHQQQQHKASTASSTTTTVKNILELIKQKKPQSNQLQRSFECEQQTTVPPPNQSLSNIKQLFLNKEPHQLKPEEEQKIRERVRKEQEHKLKLEAEKRRKALEDELRIKHEHESQQHQPQLQPQVQTEQPQQEEQTASKDENDRKQREATRKLLLEELRKEVTKEITESVKKEFEEKVKKQQERLEEKEKVIIEREKEANDKLHQSQSQLDNTQTTDDEDKRVKQTLFKTASINSNNNSNSNSNQPQILSINTDDQPFTSSSTSSINANLLRKPYHKKQNHVIIYSKKPGLRGRSAEKAQSKNFTLNTNNNNSSLNNTYLYCNNNISTQHYVQKNYNNGVINNYQYIEQYNYNTFNTNSNNNVYTNYNTTTNTYRYDYDMNPLSTANTMTSSSRYLHTSPTTHMNINIVDNTNDSSSNSNINTTTNNNTITSSSSTYNTYVHPYQYTAPPSSIYNLYQPPPSMQTTNMCRPSSPQQYDCLSINFEDLLLFEQKLMDIYRDYTYNKPMTNECFEWWNYYFNCSLFKQLEKTFKNEIARFIVQESIYYQLLSIIICYDVSSKPFVYDQVKVMIKPILIYNHHNLILIYQYILSKVPKESMNNIWVKKLSNLIYAVKSSSRNEMNPDMLFMSAPHVYNVNFTEVDKIEFITRSITGNIRILLKNYPPGNTTDILVSLFKTLKHKTYEEINDIFLSKILRVDNPNGSVLASVVLRENAFFATMEAPYLKNPSVRPYTLVLDLDETIIHFKINEHNGNEGILQVRPGIQEFLSTLGQYYEIVIFTAATQDYADLLIEGLEENTFYFDYKLYRQHTIIIGNNFVKDLTRLGRALDKVIIVDNMPQNFRLQKENGIHIRPFWGDDAQDTALIELLPILVNIAKEGGDVRKSLKKYKDEIMHKVTMNQKESS